MADDCPKETIRPDAAAGRRCGPGTALALAGALAVIGGCTFVPDEANPVEWFKGVRDWAGDRKSEAQRQAERTAERLPMPNEDAAFPNLATVPERPARFYEGPPQDVERSLREDRREAIEADEEVRSRPADFGISPVARPATREPEPRTVGESAGRSRDSGATAPQLPRRERPPPPPDISDPSSTAPGPGALRNGGGSRPAAVRRAWSPRRDDRDTYIVDL